MCGESLAFVYLKGNTEGERGISKKKLKGVKETGPSVRLLKAEGHGNGVRGEITYRPTFLVDKRALARITHYCVHLL